jgi:pyrimidine operon attenuation protein/uracil phosphoribosyltransferase
MDATAIDRALVRIAHEIVERNPDHLNDLVLIGIPKRGDNLARRIAASIGKNAGIAVPVGVLDITMYRDDIGSRASIPKPSDLPGSIDGKTVVLVDDVLFTGRSVRAALDAVVDFGRPRSVQLAVLVDRGHREFPIRADYAGKNLPTPSGANVKVELSETDGRDQVLLEEAP